MDFLAGDRHGGGAAATVGGERADQLVLALGEPREAEGAVLGCGDGRHGAVTALCLHQAVHGSIVRIEHDAGEDRTGLEAGGEGCGGGMLLEVAAACPEAVTAA